jgi:hypothetical protein
MSRTLPASQEPPGRANPQNDRPLEVRSDEARRNARTKGPCARILRYTWGIDVTARLEVACNAAG